MSPDKSRCESWKFGSSVSLAVDFGRMTTTRKLSACSETACRAGDHDSCCKPAWLLRLSLLSEHGKEATIALLGPGEFLGEGCIASNQALRMATTDSSIRTIDKKLMMRTLHGGARTVRLICCPHGRTAQPHASGLGRSTVQFERKASGASPLDPVPLRKGRDD